MTKATKKTPLVSVLVVTYNQEAYITQTLESLLMQDCAFPYEILIGEDCSTDGTRELCQSMAAKYPDRIRLFLNEKNKGFITNYFDILEHAQGKYLADCGGDDYWIRPDKLRLQVEILENHPDVSMVFGNWQMFHQKNGQLETDRSGIRDDWYHPERIGTKAAEDYLNKRNFPRMVLSTALFRTDLTQALIEEYPQLFRGKGVVCEDLPLTLGLLCKGPFYLMKEEVMVYRVLEKSVSHEDTLEGNIKGFTFDVFLQTWDLAMTLNLQIQHLKPYLSTILPQLVHYAFIASDQRWMKLLRRECQSRNIPWGYKQQFLFYCSKHSLLNTSLLRLYNRTSPNRKQP